MLPFGDKPKTGQTPYGRKPRKPEDVYQRPRTTLEAPQPAALRAPILRRHDLKEPSGPYFINGVKASDLEWRCWNALMKLGWHKEDVQFQVDALGGRMPGGQVLDFIVWAPQMPFVLFVNGDYWHGRGIQQQQDTAYKQAVIRDIWHSAVKVLDLWTADLESDEIAYRTLERELGRGG